MKKNNCLVLALVLVISILTCPTFGSAYSNYSYKVSDSLSEKLQAMSEEAVIPVNIYLKDCEKGSLSKNLKVKYDVDMEIFDNPNKLYTEVVPNMKINGVPLKKKYKESELTYENLDINNNRSSISVKEREKINFEINRVTSYYVSCYRKELTGIVGDYLDEFIKRNSAIINEIIFRPASSEFLIAKISKKNIQDIVSDSVVSDISFFEDCIQENSSWNSTSLTGSDYYTGLGSSLYNVGSGYDGTGVKIGVIEAANGKYDSSNYNLSDANISFVRTPGMFGETVSSHATNVSALICGKHVTINGKRYGGAAAGATVYQTGVNYYTDVINAIEMFCSMGVDVINYSGGSGSSGDYTDYDRQVDKLIHDNHVTMIVAAGNTSSYVLSPGKAYNAITVGNLKTKNTSNVGLVAPYSLAGTSSYVQSSYLTNKPDVVAPGTGIYLPNSSTTVAGIGSGTSFAAPIVTATVAQLIQANPVVKFSPYAVKSYLSCAASNDDITGTTQSSGKLMNETGAGLVNATKTYAVSISGNEYFGAWLSSAVPSTRFDTKETIYLNQGDRIRIALAFSKAENESILDALYGNDIDIRLISSEGSEVFCAFGNSKKNNVEIIDEVVPNTGYYCLQMRLWSSIIEPGSENTLRYWISWRIVQ